jgi:hypothetical protein
VGRQLVDYFLTHLGEKLFGSEVDLGLVQQLVDEHPVLCHPRSSLHPTTAGCAASFIDVYFVDCVFERQQDLVVVDGDSDGGVVEWVDG